MLCVARRLVDRQTYSTALSSGEYGGRKEVKFDLVPVVVHLFAHDACVVKADVV